MTARELAATDPIFIAACRKAGIRNTREEYRKWQGHHGLAHRVHVGSVDTTATSTVQRSII